MLTSAFTFFDIDKDGYHYLEDMYEHLYQRFASGPVFPTHGRGTEQEQQMERRVVTTQTTSNDSR